MENVYYHRFIGQIPTNKSSEICSFLESNSLSLFEIEFYNNDNIKIDGLISGRLIFINRDVISDYCRVEIKKEDVEIE